MEQADDTRTIRILAKGLVRGSKSKESFRTTSKTYTRKGRPNYIKYESNSNWTRTYTYNASYKGTIMTPENFAYWLKGYFEISGSNVLTEVQVQEIKNHLDLVFKKVTPITVVETTDYGQYGFIPIDDHLCGKFSFGGDGKNCDYCDERNRKTEEYNKKMKESSPKITIDGQEITATVSNKTTQINLVGNSVDDNSGNKTAENAAKVLRVYKGLKTDPSCNNLVPPSNVPMDHPLVVYPKPPMSC